MREVNGKAVSNDFVLYELSDGDIIDLSRVRCIGSLKFGDQTFAIYTDGDPHFANIKNRDGLLDAWIAYKCAQDIGWRLDNIENTLRER